MRFLLDTYIQADPSETVADFEDTGLIELIVKLGAGAIDKLPEGIKKDPEAVAETITNNMRKVIIDERAMNPKYYDKMSRAARRHHRAAPPGRASTTRTTSPSCSSTPSKLGTGRVRHAYYPDWANNGAKRALVDFFLPDELDVAVEVDHDVVQAHQAARLGRQPDEGADGQARDCARCTADDFDRRSTSSSTW